MRKTLTFLSRRLSEPSTWAALTAGVTAAAVLPEPFSWLVAALSIPGALFAEKGKAA